MMIYMIIYDDLFPIIYMERAQLLVVSHPMSYWHLLNSP